LQMWLIFFIQSFKRYSRFDIFFTIMEFYSVSATFAAC